MCEVCAVFGVGRHWADAGSLSDVTWPAPDIVRHRSERRNRVAVINRLLEQGGVRVTDWDGESYWVGCRDGRGERVADLTELWPVVERLANRVFDPLAEDFPIVRA